MILQFIKSVLGKSLHRKAIVIINITGLTIGLGVILLLINIIDYEIGVDKFHEEIDNIYYVVTRDQHTSSNSIGWIESVPALPKAMMAEFPEVKEACLIQNGQSDVMFTIGKKNIMERIQFASANLFKIFSFPVISGKMPDNDNPGNVIALSKSKAAKLFGNLDPIGKTIKINNQYDFSIIAIFEDIPINSTIRFDCWAPIEFLCEINNNENYLDTWYNLAFKSYVLLEEGASVQNVNKKLEGRIIKSNPDSKAESQLYPFSKLYTQLYGHNDRIKMIGYIIAIIFILICINFINLKTVDTFHRIKDFGVRKINGAGKGFLFKQLLMETMVIVLISVILAFLFAFLSFPVLKEYIGSANSRGDIFSSTSILAITGVALFILLLSASIPSVSLMSSSPINSLKSKVNEKIGISRLRKILTGIQFGLAIGLIICTLFIMKQIDFLQNKNLGFDKEQLVYIDLHGLLKTNHSLLKEELLKNPNIINASAASRNPKGIYWNGEGWEWEGREPHIDPLVTYVETDKDFTKTFSVRMVEGNYLNDNQAGVVINKKFASIIEPNGSALHKKLTNYGIEVEVIGITEDFHFKPLNREIGPLMMLNELGFDDMKYMFIKISPFEIDKTLKFIEKKVKAINPEFIYSYRFLDEDYANMYRNEKRLKSQLSLFSILAIIISSIGLWGILLFMVQYRIKEIGIRKVNGAKVYEILTMLNKEFIKWVIIAFIVVCPVTWYIMTHWLENFAYKTNLSWWVFILAGGLTLTIAMLTISWQSWRAAKRNPVEALRYE